MEHDQNVCGCEYRGNDAFSCGHLDGCHECDCDWCRGRAPALPQPRTFGFIIGGILMLWLIAMFISELAHS